VVDLAAARMEAIGYSNVAVLQDGIDAWHSSGFEIFQGVNVPSKAFGEVVEVTVHAPTIPAEKLAKMKAAGYRPRRSERQLPSRSRLLGVGGTASESNQGRWRLDVSNHPLEQSAFGWDHTQHFMSVRRMSLV